MVLLPRPTTTDDLEPDVEAAIAACGGDPRAAVRALLIANTFLVGELESLLSVTSTGYSRGRVRRPAKPQTE